ncbi:MAG: sulfate adenylyltransferase subunit CysN, partial [Flavobacteriaceae bacterium]|nr:sulfate adenylyltransferase subunit CysN [Flavobacteriaceae bacterium]
MTTLTQSTIGQPVSNDLLIQHSQKELLRFITCGSVDDGKSTLIGRLLLETGAVYEDQIAVLQTDSRKHGTTAEEIDPALLLDGLEDERQQGITIDVAYRYFATSQRKFIIADTPGHEQFTRNMATGASTAQLSIVLVDATKGVLTQTRRHTFIVSLLGIQHVIVAVNKMDLVEYDHNVFESIASEFRQFAEQLAIPDVRFVPISALKGDNVTSPSPNMPWYDRGSLLQQLENVNVSAEQQLSALRFPVQWVNRSNSQFRGFSGTLSAGSLKVGDQVEILPSRKISRIRRIVTRNGDLAEANASQAITVTLADEIDIARGDMIVHPQHKPLISRQVEATLVWMSEQPLVLDKPYWLKHTTRRTSGEIKQVRYSTDINTLQRSSATTLRLNDIGRCRLMLRDPIMFDSYRENRTTGSFILVDRITHETVAAGMIETPSNESLGASRWDAQPMGLSLEHVVSRIDIGERERAYGQKPF